MVKGFALVFIAATGIFLRVYDVLFRSSLTSEVAQHYLEIIRLIPGPALLSGPLTSHEWLRLSSTSYYLFYPMFALMDFHPLSLSYIWTLTGVLIIPLNYFVVKKTLDSRTAFFSTLIISISPLYLDINRIPGFFNFVIPLVYALIFVLYRVSKNKTGGLFAGSLILGLMPTLHAAAFMLIPFFIGTLLYLRKLTLSKLALIVLFISAINIPYLVSDAAAGFSMTAKFVIWVPYKFLNFLTGQVIGVQKRTVADTTISDILNFIKSGFLPDSFHWIAGAFLFGMVIYYFHHSKRSAFEKILFFWMVYGAIILFIHKNPPAHYFIPFFPIPVILISKALSRFRFGMIVLAIIVLINLTHIFLYYGRQQNPSGGSKTIYYQMQLKAMETIIKDAQGRKFSISRIGTFDQYADEFRQNYEYLLWWLGNRPVSSSSLHFVVIELPDASDKETKGEIVGTIGQIRIVRINR